MLGRNRHAGDAFFEQVVAHFEVAEVPKAELDPDLAGVSSIAQLRERINRRRAGISGARTAEADSASLSLWFLIK